MNDDQTSESETDSVQTTGSFHDELTKTLDDVENDAVDSAPAPAEPEDPGPEDSPPVDGSVEEDEADEPGDPTVPPELLELHMELEEQGKTAADMEEFNS